MSRRSGGRPPMARWRNLCLHAGDLAAQGEFWAAVVGLRVGDPTPGARGPDDQALALEGPTEGQRIWVNPVDGPKRHKHRVHLDVDAAAVADLEALGATVVAPAEETGFDWTVMADPEGGEFCCFVRDREALGDYRLHGVVVDSADPERQAAWWGERFGVEPTSYADHGWHCLERVTPDQRLTLDFVPVPEPKIAPNRVHWDVVGDRDAFMTVGASHLWDTRGWTVLADPEGNEFCVFPA